MTLLRTIRDLSALSQPVLVPTMGALHAGHIALIDRAIALARPRAAPVVVSIFVNPTQFGPSDDYDRYPRTLDTDSALARDAGADFIFAPEPATMYPPGIDIPVPPLPPVATEPGLEEHHRPGHFAGVCQVVARLFDLLRPVAAVFGEKDYQQLLVIQGMVQHMAAHEPQRWPHLHIEAVPTIREPDGLARSSRNAYLSPPLRSNAAAIHLALSAATLAEQPSDAEQRMHDILIAHEFSIDYAVVRDAATLMPVQSMHQPTRALIAARLGPTRLIDNLAMPIHSSHHA